MPLAIPFTPDAPHQVLGVELDGVSLQLEFMWNARDASWYVDFYTAELEPILLGRRVVPDLPLWGRSRDERFPGGQLVCNDTKGTGTIPGRRELGDTFVLTYFSAEEVAAGQTA